MIRIIHGSESRNEILREQVVITEDLDTPAVDFFLSSWEVVSDKKYDIDMASGFPIDHTFEKVML